MKRLAPVAALAAAALTLSACGAGGDPLAEPTTDAGGDGGTSVGEVTVGAAAFTESIILGEIYAQALTAAGTPASTIDPISSREAYLGGLSDGSIQLVPEYTGNLLLFYDANTPATTPEEIESALADVLAAEQLVIGTPSPATDEDVYVVTAEFAEENGVSEIGDLAELAPELTLAGPPELPERPYGPSGLQELYGVEFAGFEPISSSQVKASELTSGAVDVSTFFTTEAIIAENGFVQLEDPQQMILPQNITPLMVQQVADDPEALAALDAVSAALTTETLAALNARVDADRENPDAVAADWLAENGLA